MGERLIANTDTPTGHPWPAGVLVQGGATGVVMSPKGNYRTAFVEAFPGGTFLRGEGPTVREAEDACWEQYQLWLHCDGNGTHGDFERRSYRNGGAFCGRCGIWMGLVLDPLPDQGTEPHLLERALTGDAGALAEILTAMAGADSLPSLAEREAAQAAEGRSDG